MRQTYLLNSQLQLDEDREHEFKSVAHAQDVPLAIGKHCRRYVNAFLNTVGGTIYFGVQNDGTAQGLHLSRSQRDAVRLNVDKAIGSFRPQVEPQLYYVTFARVSGGPTTDARSPRSRGKNATPITLGDFLESVSADEEVGTPKPRGGGRGKHKQQWKPFPKRRRRTSSQSSDTEEFDSPPESDLFVVEVHVSKGRAPVYFMSDGTAKMRLDGSIVDMDPSTIRARITDAWKEAKSTVRNVPNVPNEFIGREADIAAICEFVYTCKDVCKVVCLFGRPGVGKSTLAYRLAAEFRELYPHEEFLCNLRSADKNTLQTVDAMGMVIRAKWPERHVNRHDEAAVRGLYRSCFAGRRTILMIENASKTEDVLPLIPRTSDCCVIVTSRAKLSLELHMPGVMNRRLQELTPQDAMALLHEYVSVPPEISAALCEKCGYLPLGIRLIGGLLMSKPNVTAQMLLKKYSAQEDRAELAGLVGVEEALDMLPPAELEAMRMLSMIPGNFDGLAAAAMLAKGYEESENIMGSLIQGSLVDYDLVTRRYWQNGLLRGYIQHHLEKEDPEKAVLAKQRFVCYYAGLLERLEGVPDRTDRVQSDRVNFERALEYAFALGMSEQTMRLAQGLYMYRYCLSTSARRTVMEYVRNRSTRSPLILGQAGDSESPGSNFGTSPPAPGILAQLSTSPGRSLLHPPGLQAYPQLLMDDTSSACSDTSTQATQTSDQDQEENGRGNSGRTESSEAENRTQGKKNVADDTIKGGERVGQHRTDQQLSSPTPTRVVLQKLPPMDSVAFGTSYYTSTALGTIATPAPRASLELDEAGSTYTAGATSSNTTINSVDTEQTTEGPDDDQGYGYSARYALSAIPSMDETGTPVQSALGDMESLLNKSPSLRFAPTLANQPLEEVRSGELDQGDDATERLGSSPDSFFEAENTNYFAKLALIPTTDEAGALPQSEANKRSKNKETAPAPVSTALSGTGANANAGAGEFKTAAIKTQSEAARKDGGDSSIDSQPSCSAQKPDENRSTQLQTQPQPHRGIRSHSRDILLFAEDEEG